MSAADRGAEPRGTEELQAVARDLRNRAATLIERYAPKAATRADRLGMIGDAAIMEHAASVIEKAVSRG